MTFVFRRLTSQGKALWMNRVLGALFGWSVARVFLIKASDRCSGARYRVKDELISYNLPTTCIVLLSVTGLHAPLNIPLPSSPERTSHSGEEFVCFLATSLFLASPVLNAQ